MNRLKMVVGFMFNEAEDHVLLIKKNKPAWQKGLLNGVGGKLESGETYEQAMAREFMEETGIEHADWRRVISMGGDDWVVQVFTASCNSVYKYQQLEAEQLMLIPLENLHWFDIVSNLGWLIPMCLDRNDGKGKIDYCLTNEFAE